METDFSRKLYQCGKCLCSVKVIDYTPEGSCLSGGSTVKPSSAFQYTIDMIPAKIVFLSPKEPQSNIEAHLEIPDETVFLGINIIGIVKVNDVFEVTSECRTSSLLPKFLP